LFDLISGSESSAIIATSLVVPNDDVRSDQKNKFFADTALEFFEKKVDYLYKDE